MSENGFWETALIYASVVLAWLGGEAGRAYVAGAAGGLMRWWMSERRRLRDGIPAAITGAIFARYMSPVVLAIIEGNVGQLGAGATDTATFATGLLGMGAAKVVLAAVERRAVGKGGDDGRG